MYVALEGRLRKGFGKLKGLTWDRTRTRDFPDLFLTYRTPGLPLSDSVRTRQSKHCFVTGQIVTRAGLGRAGQGSH